MVILTSLIFNLPISLKKLKLFCFSALGPILFLEHSAYCLAACYMQGLTSRTERPWIITDYIVKIWSKFEKLKNERL